MQSNPIEKEIWLDKLKGKTNLSKGILREELNRLGLKAKGIEQENQEQISFNKQVLEEAKQIIKSEKAIEFITKETGKLHLKDEREREVLWLNTLTSELDYKNHTGIVGKTGTGKDDLVRAVLATVPPQWVAKTNVNSPKAPYYAASAGKIKDGAVLYYQDISLSDEMINVLKNLATDTTEDLKQWTVTEDRQFLEQVLKRHYAVFFTTLNPPSSDQGQTLRRYLFLNPTEEKADHLEIQSTIKENERLGELAQSEPFNKELCQCITYLIKTQQSRVIIPFDFDLNEKDSVDHTELKQFCSLVKAIAKANYLARIKLEDNLLAEPQDLELANNLWKTLQKGKISTLQKELLSNLPENEPEEIYNKEENKWYWASDCCATSSDLAKKLAANPSHVRDALYKLYTAGKAEREKRKGAPNSYKYWKPNCSTVPTVPDRSNESGTVGFAKLLPIDPKKILSVLTVNDHSADKEKNLAINLYCEKINNYCILEQLEQLPKNKEKATVPEQMERLRTVRTVKSHEQQKAMESVEKNSLGENGKTEPKTSFGICELCGERKELNHYTQRWICSKCYEQSKEQEKWLREEREENGSNSNELKEQVKKSKLILPEDKKVFFKFLEKRPSTDEIVREGPLNSDTIQILTKLDEKIVDERFKEISE